MLRSNAAAVLTALLLAGTSAAADLPMEADLECGVTSHVIVKGILSDVYCSDNSAADPDWKLPISATSLLTQPETHKYACFYDMSVCKNSGYDLLVPKAGSTTEYEVGYRLSSDLNDKMRDFLEEIKGYGDGSNSLSDKAGFVVEITGVSTYNFTGSKVATMGADCGRRISILGFNGIEEEATWSNWGYTVGDHYTIDYGREIADPGCKFGSSTSHSQGLGTACCPEECGECGGDGCSSRLKSDWLLGDHTNECCVGYTIGLSRSCDDMGAPCTVNDGTAIKNDHSVPDPTCARGFTTDDSQGLGTACCPAGCMECGGDSCSTRSENLPNDDGKYPVDGYGEQFANACCVGSTLKLGRSCDCYGPPCTVEAVDSDGSGENPQLLQCNAASGLAATAATALMMFVAALF